MSETSTAEVAPPLILGAAGDIGRTALQQLLADGVTPAGVVLTERRLDAAHLRSQTAHEIATNYTPDGQGQVLEEVELETNRPNGPLLRVAGVEIPVFTPESQHEAFAERHPVIDATGQNKRREKLEPMLEAGAQYVVITSPIHEREGVNAVVYGVNSDDERFLRAAHDGLLSTSSCTTTAVSSLLGPLLLGDKKIDLSGALVNVTHARTKSNDPEDIANNIKLSSSGAVLEIPKILAITPDQLAFDLKCTRTNVACGSLANVSLLFGPEFPTYNLQNLRTRIKNALSVSESVTEIDDSIKDVKGVVGRLASAVINLESINLQRMPGGGSVATDINIFYDNVYGYTRSVLDSYRAMTTVPAAYGARTLEESRQDELAGAIS